MLIGLSLLVNLLRGTPKFESIIGLSSCDWESLCILAAFFVVCVLVTWYNIRAIVKEQALKQKFGKFHKSQEVYSRPNLPKLLFMSFISAFIGQMFGLGGGIIYQPLLIKLGMHPLVTGSTVLYMIQFGAATSMSTFLIYG